MSKTTLVNPSALYDLSWVARHFQVQKQQIKRECRAGRIVAVKMTSNSGGRETFKIQGDEVIRLGNEFMRLRGELKIQFQPFRRVPARALEETRIQTKLSQYQRPELLRDPGDEESAHDPTIKEGIMRRRSSDPPENIEDVVLGSADDDLIVVLAGLNRFQRHDLLRVAPIFAKFAPNSMRLDRLSEVEIRSALRDAARQAHKTCPADLAQMRAQIKTVSIEILRRNRQQAS